MINSVAEKALTITVVPQIFRSMFIDISGCAPDIFEANKAISKFRIVAQIINLRLEGGYYYLSINDLQEIKIDKNNIIYFDIKKTVLIS